MNQKTGNEVRPFLALAARNVVVWLGAAMMTACGGGGSESIGTACTLEIDEPVLTLRTAANINTGAPIAELRISNIQFGGVALDPAAAAIRSKNLTVSAGGLVCSVPCAFGSNEGTFSFTVSAQGFQAKDYSVKASFATKSLECPAHLGNGTKIDVLLGPT